MELLGIEWVRMGVRYLVVGCKDVERAGRRFQLVDRSCSLAARRWAEVTAEVLFDVEDPGRPAPTRRTSASCRDPVKWKELLIIKLKLVMIPLKITKISSLARTARQSDRTIRALIVESCWRCDWRGREQPARLYSNSVAFILVGQWKISSRQRCSVLILHKPSAINRCTHSNKSSQKKPRKK